MVTRNWLKPVLGLALGTFTGCLAYNEDCSPLVDNPDEVVGTLGTDTDITKPSVRTSNNLVGQMVAEAYTHSIPGDAIDIGTENAGDIRADGVCETHNVLPRGSVLKKTLREVLPFDDTVVAVSVTPGTLKAVLEHSVANLVDATKTNGNTPSGAFLQLAGATVSADCTRTAASNGVPGLRITRIELDGGRVVWDGAAFDDPARTIRVAVNSYVLTGGDGYTMLKGLDPAQAKPVTAAGLNFQIVARWFAQSYVAPQQPLSTDHKPSGGWLLTQCR
jgi:2',3'-cyclic-nucleotide 2'-phosphodiesterase (5'-nucleotidase family)